MAKLKQRNFDLSYLQESAEKTSKEKVDRRSIMSYCPWSHR